MNHGKFALARGPYPDALLLSCCILIAFANAFVFSKSHAHNDNAIFDEKYACVTNQSPLESQFHTEISGYSTITLQRCKIS